MPRRKVELDIKVNVMRESLHLANVQSISQKYGVSERSAYNWYERILDALPDILADDRPGPKSLKEAEVVPPF